MKAVTPETGVIFGELTRDEFRAKFIRASGMSEEDFDLLGFRIVPCRCGHSFCEGWAVGANFMISERLNGD